MTMMLVKPTLFLFIGLAMIAVSLIIIVVFIINPSSSIARKAYDQPQYQKCLDEFTEIYDMHGDNKLNEGEILSLTTI